MNPSTLKTKLSAYEVDIKQVENRMKDPHIHESTYRELLKRKNELTAEIQHIRMQLAKLPDDKSLDRSLNESFDL